MIKVDINISPRISTITRSLEATESHIQRAVVRTLNKVARWLQSHVSRETAKDLNIKVGLVRRSLVVVRAKRGRVNSSVGLPPKKGVINSINLGSPQQNKRGVRVARRQYDDAFIATMPRGNKGIFWRTTDDRLPIREVQVVITGRMAKVMERLSEGPAMRQFDKVFESELNYILRHEKR